MKQYFALLLLFGCIIFKFFRNNRRFHMLTLHVFSVQEEDYNQNYTCVVSKSDGSPATRHVHILKPGVY